jgi:hypothetical protein
MVQRAQTDPHLEAEVSAHPPQRLRIGRGDRNWPLNEAHRPNFRGVRVHVSTGYNPGERNRRASRNGRVSDLPPETPTVTIRD